MPISSKELQHIASLAYLDITSDNTNKLNEEISSIMDFVEHLQKIDTKDVAPLFHPLAMETRFRDDKITEENCIEQLEAIASSFEEGMYLVPQVVDSGS